LRAALRAWGFWKAVMKEFLWFEFVGVG